MKKLVSILSILTIAFSLSLTACGNQEPETPEAPTESQTEETEGEANE